MKKSLFPWLLLGVFLVILAAGCKKKKYPAPEIPPSSSMVMAFADFWDDTASKTYDSTMNNLIFAGGNVLVWNVILTIGLAVPVASFLESFKHEPSWDKNEKAWIWSYSVAIGFDNYTAELHGRADGDSVYWSMYISKSGGFANFLWYTGTSKLDKTAGTWLMNNSPWNQTPLLQIDWHNNTDGTSDIRYMNVVPGGAENGGYIQYGIVSSPDLDAFYDIYNKGQNNLTGIKWNRSSRAGRASDYAHYGDSLWHCWNEALRDTTCQ